MGESVGHHLHNTAHGHVAPLKQFLNDQLSRITVECLGCVYVAWIAQNPQDPLAARLVLHRTPWSFATYAESACAMLHQHTQRLLHLENREKGGLVVRTQVLITNLGPTSVIVCLTMKTSLMVVLEVNNVPAYQVDRSTTLIDDGA